MSLDDAPEKMEASHSGATGALMTGKNVKAYPTLDGLRGVAALSVAILHMPHIFGNIKVPNAHLAVDFFFQLSGFVIAFAYSSKISAGLKLTDFVMLRFNRLFPAAFLGSILGVIVALLALKMGGNGLTVDWTWPSFIAAVVTNLLMLPTPWPESHYLLYPLNPVMWSVFFEIVVNVLFFISIQRFAWRRWGVIAIISSALFLLISIRMTTIDYGFSWTEFGFGLLRTIVSFSIGLVLFNANIKQRINSDILVCIIALFLAIVVLAQIKSIYYELVAVLLLFPGLIYCGIICQPVRTTYIFEASGAASYVLYAIHKPTYQIFYALLKKAEPGMAEKYAPLFGFIFLGALFLFCIFLAGTYESYGRKLLASYSRKLTTRLSGQKASTEAGS